MPTLVVPVRPSPATVNAFNDETFFMDPENRPADETLPPVLRREPVTDDRKSGQRSRRKTGIAVGCAAVILIVLGYLGFANPHLVSRLKESVLAYIPSGSAVAPPTPAAPPQVTVTTTPPSSQPAILPVPVPAPVPPRPNPSPTSRNHECTIGKNLEHEYLNLAIHSQNSGNGANAIRQYNRVLDCDPGNSEAREGLQRAKKAQTVNGPGL